IRCIPFWRGWRWGGERTEILLGMGSACAVRKPGNASWHILFRFHLLFWILFLFFSLPFPFIFCPGFPWEMLGFPGCGYHDCFRGDRCRWRWEARGRWLAQGLPCSPASEIVIAMPSNGITGEQFQLNQGREGHLDAFDGFIKMARQHPAMRPATSFVISSQDQQEQDHLRIALQFHEIRIGKQVGWDTATFCHDDLLFSRESTIDEQEHNEYEIIDARHWYAPDSTGCLDATAGSPHPRPAQ